MSVRLLGGMDLGCVGSRTRFGDEAWEQAAARSTFHELHLAPTPLLQLQSLQPDSANVINSLFTPPPFSPQVELSIYKCRLGAPMALETASDPAHGMLKSWDPCSMLGNLRFEL